LGQSRPPLPGKDLEPVLEAVRLAPSGHNTQPWQLCASGETGFRVAWDRERWPRAADPDGEVLACSLGCAIEAAASVARIAHEDCPAAARGSLPGHAGQVHVEALEPSCDERLALLRERRTNRAPFERADLRPQLLQRVARAGSILGAEIGVLADRERVDRVAQLAALGARAWLSDPVYLEELLAWIRLQPPHEDGFDPASLGLDALTRAAIGQLQRRPRWRALAPRLGMARIQGAQIARAVRHSGALVAILVRDDWASWVRGGRAMLALWLEATRAGLGVQPVHFPLLLDDTRREVMHLLGGAGDLRALSLLRVGWPTRPAPASGRLPLGRIWRADPDEGRT
jgi:nitroreductase